MFTILFWFLIIFSLFRFVFGFVIPLLTTTRQLRARMKDMQDQSGTSSNYKNDISPEQKRSAPVDGDYIDFEEVK